MTSHNPQSLPFECEEGFRALLEAAPDAILAVNDRGEIVLFNSQAERLFGYAREELLGQSLEMLLPERARQVHSQYRQAYFAKPQYRSMGSGAQYRGRRKDGREFPIDVNLSPVETAEGMFFLSAIREVGGPLQTAAELRTIEARFASIFRATPAAISISTLSDGRILEANDRFLEVVGYRRDEVIGHTVFELGVWAHPEHRARLAEKLRTQGALRDEEMVFRTRAGAERQGRISVQPFPIGREPGLLSILEDITEHKRAERELWQAKELLETMFSSIDLMVAYLDRDLNFIRVNRAYAAADEHEPEFYIGKNHFDLFPNAENEAIFWRVVETGEPYSVYAKPFEYAEHPERGVTHWDWSLQPVKDAEAKVTGLVLSLVNVTERIHAEEAYQHAAQRLRYVLASAPLSIWAVDRNGVYTLVEGSLTSSLGFKTADLVGQSIWERSRSRPDIQELIARAFRGEEVTADLEWLGRVIHTRYSPVKNAAGEVVGLIGISFDITERSRAEERLRELAREVILLQEEDRRRISFQLQNDAAQVLSAVKMNLVSILDEVPLELTLVSRCLAEAAAQIGETIEQVGALGQDLRPTSLDTLGLDGALAAYCDLFAQRVKLPIEYVGGDAIQLSDAASITLYRFLQEALANVVKHAQAQRIRVTLRKEATRVWLLIEDNGRGFDLQASSSSVEGCRGSGLAAMRERLKLLEGALEIQSQPGQGTRVVAQVPWN